MAKRPYDSRYWRNTIRPIILNRDNHTCQLHISKKCKQVATQVHHITDWQDGGDWYHLPNLVAVCQPCNLAARIQRQVEAVRRERGHTPHTPSRPW